MKYDPEGHYRAGKEVQPSGKDGERKALHLTIRSFLKFHCVGQPQLTHENTVRKRKKNEAEGMEEVVGKKDIHVHLTESRV